MARLFWMLLVAALALALVVGASWALSYSRVASLLGDPPPEMGVQTTTFLWDASPPVWSFAYGPTRIPGAPSVRIYVSPIGRLVQTEPADLAARVKKLHATGY